MRASAFKERRDHGLHDSGSAVIRADITPRLQIMRLRYVPVHVVCGLVFVDGELYAQLELCQRLVKFQIDRSVVHRVAAKDDQCLYFAGVHISYKLTDGLPVLHRIGLNRINIADGLAHIAERSVHSVCQGMHRGRLEFTRDYQTLAFVLEKVRSGGIRPFALLVIEIATLSRNAELRCQIARKTVDFRWPQHQSMIGLGAGGAGRALRHVKAVHLIALLQLAITHEVASVAHKTGEPRAGEEVRVKRDYNAGGIEFVNRVVVRAKSEFGAGAGAVTVYRVPAMPLGLGIEPLHVLHLPGK